MALSTSPFCPCCDLTDALQPQILCIVWLAARIIYLRTLAPKIGHTRKKDRETRETIASAPMWREEGRGGFSRDHLSQAGKPRPARKLPRTRTSYQRTAFPRERCFVMCILPTSPEPPADVRGPGKSCPLRCLRIGTTDALHKVHLHGVAFGWRPDRGRHQGSAMVGLNGSTLLHPGG